MFQLKQRLDSSKSATLISAMFAVALLNACSSNDNNSVDPNLDNPDPGNGSMPSASIDLVPVESAVPSVGTIYTDRDGKTLYTRFGDNPDTVTCTSDCAQQWPPLTTTITATGISGNFDVIPRDDGTSQWTLLGFPLHSFAGDAATGDVNGDGVDNQWALARPIPVTSADIDEDEALVALGSTSAGGSSNVRFERSNFTLYIFADDTNGVSNCSGGCATSWPPLYADTGAVADGDRYTLITREDGSTQWAYDGMALYFWQGDTAAGEFGGAQVTNWSVARP